MYTFVLFADPLKELPALVTSPVAVPIVLAVVRVAALPVVFWLSVGKSPATAAATEVPFPLNIPVTDVLIVSIGVDPPDEDPANPFEDAIEIDVTPPPELPLSTQAFVLLSHTQTVSVEPTMAKYPGAPTG